MDQLLSDTLVQKRDASTETPTHFIKKHIDVNYHWNEWELRRRALRVVNLRKVGSLAKIACLFSMSSLLSLC